MIVATFCKVSFVVWSVLFVDNCCKWEQIRIFAYNIERIQYKIISPSRLCDTYKYKYQKLTSSLHQTTENNNGFVSPNDNESNSNSKKREGGYRFGDITRSITQKINVNASKITGKDTYEFGDISKWADRRIKERIISIKSQQSTTTAVEEYKYEFGDISRLADHYVKEQAAKFSGKEKATDYQFGDVTKTLIKKVITGEYDPQDVYLALRVLVVAGCMILPITQMLPINTLFEMFELGLLKDVGFRLLPVVATAIDGRMKEALTGNANYQLGDITKERLRQQLARFTGKDTYEIGDITRAVMVRGEKDTDSNVLNTGDGNCEGSILSIDDPTLLNELTSWDERFLENNRNATTSVA